MLKMPFNMRFIMQQAQLHRGSAAIRMAPDQLRLLSGTQYIDAPRTVLSCSC